MLELAQAADRFGQRPCQLFGFDLSQADPDLMKDFDFLCSLRLILWDVYVAEKQAEALKDAREGNVTQQTHLQLPDGTLIPIPEYQN